VAHQQGRYLEDSLSVDAEKRVVRPTDLIVVTSTNATNHNLESAEFLTHVL
jgi:hypothetical protein